MIQYGNIQFDKPTFNRFKRLYDKAVKENKSQFGFDGQEILTQYAKYVLEYLSPKFK